MKNILFYFVFFFALKIQAATQVYTGLNTGNLNWQETASSSTYNLTNAFFTGHFGFTIGSRFLLETSTANIGVVAELSWLGDSIDRKQVNLTNASTYRFESYRLIGGVSSALKLGVIDIVLEYYPFTQNKITYSDEKSQNPFIKNDNLKTSGYGLGFNFHFQSDIAYSVIYKKLSYENVEMNGTETALPNSQFSKLEITDIMASVYKSF